MYTLCVCVCFFYSLKRDTNFVLFHLIIFFFFSLDSSIGSNYSLSTGKMESAYRSFAYIILFFIHPLLCVKFSLNKNIEIKGGNRGWLIRWVYMTAGLRCVQDASFCMCVREYILIRENWVLSIKYFLESFKGNFQNIWWVN